jgi:DNA polymerase I-like protein with 3'-5' exonuclease and polymerase domains
MLFAKEVSASMKYKSPPASTGRKKVSGERYEEPFEVQKARQDKARGTPSLGEEAFHGVLGRIARKVAKETEADARAILVGLLVGIGNIIGRTVHWRVDDTQHYCNEFACFVGRTAGARKGLATDIVEGILRLISDVWHQACIARGVSSGEGFIELVHDEVTKQVKVKPEKGEKGPARFETQVVKEGVVDKRKLCLLSEFGELLTVSTRDGNIISTVLRNCWDGKTLEINTKQFPQRATGAHISIIGNITQKELLALLPKIPNADGFCNRFLWCLIERSQYKPLGGPRLAEYLVKEITELRGILARLLGTPVEIGYSPEAEALWKEIYTQLSSETDLARAVVDRAEPHNRRLSLLYALLDGLQQVQEIHIKAALALWRYCEECAVRLFGVEELDREAHLTLDYLRSKGSQGATRTEIQNRVFYNHRTGTEIHGWLCALAEKQLARYETEKNDNGNTVERWFAVQYSGPSPEKPPQSSKKARKKNEFVANSFLYVTQKARIPEILASLNGASSIALDTETSNDKLRLLQLCDGTNPPVILDIPSEDIKAAVVEFLRGRELIIQSSKFDLRVLREALGIEISVARVFDTYIASALLTNTKVTEELKKQRRRNWHPNSLESIAQRILGITLDKTFQKADWSVDLSLPENAPMLAYAVDDVRYLHAIRLHQEAELESQKLRPVYELERDLVPCVNAMSEAGLCLDIEEVRHRAAEALELTARREAMLLSLLKRKINVRSRKAQLLPALQELGITFKGEELTSTDKKILPLVDQKDHPVILAVLEWSSVNEEAKQLAQWPKWMDEENIVRPQLNQFGTVTGRFTYSEPNLQQVKKSALRSIITAPPGYLILRADFKTIEIILAAVRYGETAILEQVAAGADLHTVTAAVLFHCSLEDVTRAQREMAKTTNFSLLYGRSLESYITACRLAKITDSVEELERIYCDFDKAWPKWAATKRWLPRRLPGEHSTTKSAQCMAGGSSWIRPCRIARFAAPCSISLSSPAAAMN